MLSQEYRSAQQLVTELNDQLQTLEEGKDVPDDVRMQASRDLNSLQQVITRVQQLIPIDQRTAWKAYVPGPGVQLKLPWSSRIYILLLDGVDHQGMTRWGC